MTGKKPFKPLAEDLDDLAERVAAEKNIPTLTSPMRVREEGRRAGGPPPRAPDPPSVRTVAAARSNYLAPAQLKSAPATGITEVRLRCPIHIRGQLAAEQLRLRQEGQSVTLNYLILAALRQAGYRVEDSDLIEDGRRLR
jgi:hypothetical protein